MMKRSIIPLILVLLLISPIMAEVESLGVFKQNSIINLVQTCENCSFVNITKVQLPNSTINKLDELMTKSNYDYNYSFSQTSSLGKYIATTCGDVDGVITCVSYDFEVTTTGAKVSLSNIILIIAFLLVALICFIVGQTFSNDKWLVKSIFFISAILFGILAINSGKIIASESLELSTMGTTGLVMAIAIFLFLILYVFIFWTIETIKSLKQKQGVRWNY